MTPVKRYSLPTLPGRITRDCVTVVEARDYDELMGVLQELLESFSDGGEPWPALERARAFVRDGGDHDPR